MPLYYALWKFLTFREKARDAVSSKLLSIHMMLSKSNVVSNLTETA